jgi:hypothetical protein
MNDAWRLCETVDRALRDGDVVAARRAIDAAMSIAARETTPRLDAELALLASEVAACEGDERRAATMSDIAERGMLALGDDAGLVAVRYARALRALRGDPAVRLAGMDMAASLLPSLDVYGPAHGRVWLRLELAVALAESARLDDALELAGEAFERARPPTNEWACAGVLVARLLARSDRPEAAARVAIGMLADARKLDTRLRAELYDVAAAAVDGLGQPELAARLADIAVTLERA